MSGKSRHTKNWRSWAKKTPLQFRDPLDERGDVYMSNCQGNSREEALQNLTESDLKI